MTMELCELCSTPVASRHGHIVDTRRRRLMCACRACFLLFTQACTDFRAVPERYLWDPDRPVTAIDWTDLGTPVMFFLRRATGITAFAPGPAGATECLLRLGVWDELTADHPLMAAAEPDVEAILLRRGECGTDCFLVPIDVCYRLVGTVRRYWCGPDGGHLVRKQLDELFAEIRDRAAPMR